MRYWWVSQNQTYRHEVPGGYLWSPKLGKSGGRVPYYEFMREVSPGDIVFSFADTYIKAVGVAVSHAYSAPKPTEFQSVGSNWGHAGWKVDVRFQVLKHPIRPREYMREIAPLLPDKYSPLQPSGDGNVLYLTELSGDFAKQLADIIGAEASSFIDAVAAAPPQAPDASLSLLEWEEKEVLQVQANPGLTETTKEAIVQARRGQGLFKRNVMQLEKACRLTGVSQVEHLRASHCKPWREADNIERLDGNNGLLLTPSADHLFDRGFISFQDDGTVIYSPVAHGPSLRAMGFDPSMPRNVGAFNLAQQVFLKFHRDNVFLKVKKGKAPKKK